MKYSKLLAFLLAPFFMFVGDDDGGGGGGGGDNIDRGDTLAAGAPDEADDKGVDDAEAAALAALAAKEVAKEAGGKDAEDKDPDDTDDDAEKKPKKDSRIPLARHKELLEKERARATTAEARAAELEKGVASSKVAETIEATETKLGELETQYTKLVADGELAKAAAMMREIRTLERSIGETNMTANIQAAEARAVERVRYDTTVERLEEAYPVLNPESDEFDADQVQDVLDLKSVYQGRGLSASAALQKAAAKTFGAVTAKQEKATEGTPKVDAKAVAAQRKADALKKGVDAASKTPADASKVGADSDKIGGTLTAENIMSLKQSEFDKLDEKTLAKARGDLL